MRRTSAGRAKNTAATGRAAFYRQNRMNALAALQYISTGARRSNEQRKSGDDAPTLQEVTLDAEAAHQDDVRRKTRERGQSYCSFRFAAFAI
jgi:hypothetical protein